MDHKIHIRDLARDDWTLCGMRTAMVVESTNASLLGSCPYCLRVFRKGRKVYEPDDGTYPPDRQEGDP